MLVCKTITCQMLQSAYICENGAPSKYPTIQYMYNVIHKI